MNIQNTSGRRVTITIDDVSHAMAPNDTATFPDTAKARADFNKLKSMGIAALFSDATHPLISDSPLGAAVFYGAMILATGQPTSGNIITIQGKIFEFNNSAVAAGRTAVAISGVNAGATYASLQTAVNADADLKALGVRIPSKLVVSATNDIRLAVQSPDELALTVTEGADNLTVTSPALITRAAARQEIFSVTAAATTIAIDTGFDSIGAVTVQVRTAAGVTKAYDGAVTVANGIVYLDAAGSTDIASTDIVTLHVSGS